MLARCMALAFIDNDCDFTHDSPSTFTCDIPPTLHCGTPSTFICDVPPTNTCNSPPINGGGGTQYAEARQPTPAAHRPRSTPAARRAAPHLPRAAAPHFILLTMSTVYSACFVSWQSQQFYFILFICQFHISYSVLYIWQWHVCILHRNILFCFIMQLFIYLMSRSYWQKIYFEYVNIM